MNTIAAKFNTDEDHGEIEPEENEILYICQMFPNGL